MRLVSRERQSIFFVDSLKIGVGLSPKKGRSRIIQTEIGLPCSNRGKPLSELAEQGFAFNKEREFDLLMKPNLTYLTDLHELVRFTVVTVDTVGQFFLGGDLAQINAFDNISEIPDLLGRVGSQDDLVS